MSDQAYGDYDVIVVGAGHAGCEAALAAARMGARTLLLTMNMDLIAQMPCNPSVGGPAKGHVVRELAMLGGEMPRNIDKTFVQIRMLNDSRGPAVQALRAQADKRLYSIAMKHTLEHAPNLSVKQGLVDQVLVEGDRVRGVSTNYGQVYHGKTVILTAGTFMAGRILTGQYSMDAGRAGEFPARGLSASLAGLGFKLVRFQTNTPPRIDARTIDFSKTDPQPGSETPLYFCDEPPTVRYHVPASSELSEAGLWSPRISPIYPIPHQTAWRAQVPCYLVFTNERTHQIIRDNLHLSPIAPGVLDAAGPRYCPSIEEKIVRFGHKSSHHLFLEPEGFNTAEVYVQGFFTGLPEWVQLQMLHSIPALEQAEIMRAGYAIEYDHVPPNQITASLETKRVEGLFLAGQLNGTSGYEEAAAQGMVAGINAARRVAGQPAVTIGRDQAYMGVLIDDLVTKELEEPYRLLTSRAEYRLLLRQSNADRRLTPLGYELGLVPYERYRAVQAKWERIDKEPELLAARRIEANAETNDILASFGLEPLRETVHALQLLRRPEVSPELLRSLGAFSPDLTPEQIEQVTIDAKYEGYIIKQERQVKRMQRLENWRVPAGTDYAEIVGLRNEAREKLERFRPATLAQASRIQGINPADVSILMVHLQRQRGAGAQA